MTGPVRNPDIQNLFEAFASLKRGLQCSKVRSSGPHSLGNESLESLSILCESFGY